MANQEMIISQLRQRLEILWQLIERNDGGGGGGSGDAYTKQESDARYVQKVAGKGLSTNDFTDAYKDQISTNATNIGALDSAIDALFTPANINISQGGTLDSDTLALVELHQPIKLNGNQYYFLAGDSNVADYFAVDIAASGLVVYFARITLSNGQVSQLTSVVSSDTPSDGGDDIFTTGGAYDLQVALESLIGDKIELSDAFGMGTKISGVDLNDYKENHIGQYYTENSAGSASLANCPYTSTAGHLTVQELSLVPVQGGDPETYILQTWSTASAEGQYQTYQRKYRGHYGWTEWFRLPVAYDELMQPIVSLANIDLDNLKTPGVYRYTATNANTITNRPISASGGSIVIVRAMHNSTSFRQEVYPSDSTYKYYARPCYNGTWTQGWYAITAYESDNPYVPSP